MADIEFSIPHKCSKIEAKRRIEQEILGGIGDVFDIKARWEGDTCHVSGPVQGTLMVLDKSVKIDIKLGFRAKLIRGKIESKLQDKLKKVLG